MVNQFFKELNGTVRYWYLLMVMGLVFIAAGVWVTMTPLEAYLSLALLFTIMFLVTGNLEIAFSISNREELDGWGWSLAIGIVDIVLGVLLVVAPGLSIVILPFYVGFGIMFHSAIAMGWSLKLKKHGVLSWGNLMVLGFLGLLLSFFLIWQPLIAGITLVVCTAVAFISIGIFQIVFSFKLKKLHLVSKKLGMMKK